MASSKRKAVNDVDIERVAQTRRLNLEQHLQRQETLWAFENMLGELQYSYQNYLDDAMATLKVQPRAYSTKTSTASSVPIQ